MKRKMDYLSVSKVVQNEKDSFLVKIESAINTNDLNLMKELIIEAEAKGLENEFEVEIAKQKVSEHPSSTQ